jgi:hypothetical protein
LRSASLSSTASHREGCAYAEAFGYSAYQYPALSYQEKGALVDELAALSEFHRKSVLRLLRQQRRTMGGHRLVLKLVTIQLRWANAAADQPGDDRSTAGTRPLCAGWSASSPPYTCRHRGLYLGSLRTFQRRMGEWRITHAERKPLRTKRQLDGYTIRMSQRAAALLPEPERVVASTQDSVATLQRAGRFRHRQGSAVRGFPNHLLDLF